MLALTFTRKAAGELTQPAAPARPARPRRGRHVPRGGLRPAPRPLGRPRHPARPSCSTARSASSPGCCRAGVGARRRVARRRHRDRVGQGPRRSTPDDYAAEASRIAPPGRRSPTARWPRVFERYEDEKRASAHGRLRRPAAAVPARPARRPRVRPGPAVAVPAPVRRRVPGRQPAAAAAARGLARRPRRPLRGRRPQPGHLRAGTAPTRRPSPTSPTATRAARSSASPTTTARRPRSWRWPTRCWPAARSTAPAAADAARLGPAGQPARRAAARPSARSPTTRPRPGPSPASVRDHHAPGRPWSAQAVLVPHQRPDRADRAGAAPGRHPVPGPGRRRLLDQPEVKAALRDLQRSTGDFARPSPTSADRRPSAADAGADGRPRPPSDEPAGDARRRPRRQPRGAGPPGPRLRRRRQPTRPPPGFVAWLHSTTAGRPARRARRRRRDRHVPRGQGPRVAGRAPRRPRAGPGARSATPRTRRGAGRGAPPLLRRRHPGRARAASAPGPRRRTFGDRAVAAASRSPYLDEVEAACRALAAGDVPADWAAHLAAQRATLRDRRLAAADVAPGRRRARRPGRPRPQPHAAASDLDDAGLATLDALKAWRSRPGPGRRGAAARHLPRPGAARGRRQPTRAPAPTCSPSPGIGEVKVERFGDEILGIVGRARGILSRCASTPSSASPRRSTAVLGAVHRPRLLPDARRACRQISAPEVRRPLGVGRHGRASACASATPATCRRPRSAFIDPAKLSWVEELVFDLDRRARADPRCCPTTTPTGSPARAVYVVRPTTATRQHPAPRRRPQGAGAAGRRPGRAGARVGPAGARRGRAATLDRQRPRSTDAAPHGGASTASAVRRRRRRGGRARPRSRWRLRASAKRPKSIEMNRPSASAHSRSVPSGSVA